PALADWRPPPKARSPLRVLVLPGGRPSCRQSRCNTARHHHSRPYKGSVHWCRDHPNTAHAACAHNVRSEGADQETLAGANRRHRFVTLRAHGVTPHHSSVLFVCGPVNVTYMMIADEDAALFGGAHRALTFLKPAVHQHGRYRTPSPNVGTSIEGIAQNITDQALRRNLPHQPRPLNGVGRQLPVVITEPL